MKSSYVFVLLAVLYTVLPGTMSRAAQKSEIPDNLKSSNFEKPPLNGGGCKPKTCEEMGGYSGSINDGCGNVVDFGVAKQASVTVDLPQYTGVCPITLKFTGTITASKEGIVCYRFFNPFSFNNGHSLIGGPSGELVFETAGTKQIIYEWQVPVNLPHDYQYILFDASGAKQVQLHFNMNCTKFLKPTGGNTIPQ